MRGGSLVVYLVLGLAVSSLETAIFEVDGSLKWMPQQSKPKSGTCTPKNKTKQNTPTTTKKKQPNF